MKRRGEWIAAFVLVGLLLGIAGSIGMWASYRFRVAELARFEEQSLRLAGVFARAAESWISRGRLDALEGMAHMLLAGSGQYVEVVVGDDTILSKMADDLGPDAPKTPQDLGLSGSIPRGVLRDDGLDVVFPLELTGDQLSVGYVQIGFDREAAARRIREHSLIVLGAAFGSWAALATVLLLGLRVVLLRRRLAGATGMTVPSGVVHAGTLEIDTDTCDVHLAGVPIELTPKMFDLLVFLAQNEGKTFSDGELLSALWADSPYAASNDVKQCIYMLRRRLRAAHPNPKRIIVNVKGFGYKLVPPTEAPLIDD